MRVLVLSNVFHLYWKKLSSLSHTLHSLHLQKKSNDIVGIENDVEEPLGHGGASFSETAQAAERKSKGDKSLMESSF